jgi:hypothetical protein
MLGGILSAAALSAVNTAFESTADYELLRLLKVLHSLLTFRKFYDAGAGPSGEGHREDEGGGVGEEAGEDSEEAGATRKSSEASS